jgi:hypothetical protein
MTPENPIRPGSSSPSALPDGTPRGRARSVPRLALTPVEAAESIGVGRTFFDEQVMPELRVVRRGSKVLVPVPVLEAWLERNAARTLGG